MNSGSKYDPLRTQERIRKGQGKSDVSQMECMALIVGKGKPRDLRRLNNYDELMGGQSG